MKTFLFLLMTLCCLPSVPDAAAASGIKGRSAWQGQLVPGIKVRAYEKVADIAADKPVAVSASSDLDGTYRIDLPPGSYYLTARDFEGEPEPGSHFCYYSGAPVTVAEGGYTNVGFNLIRIPAEAPPKAGSRAGIRGEITFEGAPLERCYLYVYKDPSRGFKGPAYFIQPVAKGNFRLRLPPGEYYLLARKRARGGQFGPIEIGDYFNYYHGNPVRIEAGQEREVKIETITRLSMLEEDEAPPFRGITGTVLGPGEKPTAGLHVFAYRDSAMSGTPDAFSPATGAEGEFSLPLPDQGPWYLLAREAFGGPAAEDELYGKYAGSADHAVTLQADKSIPEVTIHVDRKKTF